MSQAALDALPFFRQSWTFPDSCVIKRKTADLLNQSTGEYTPTFAAPSYSGPCLIRPESSSDVEAGQELLALHGYTVFIPYTENDQLPEDVVDITSATDTMLNGRQFVVKNIPVDTYVTVRRLICEDVTSG